MRTITKIGELIGFSNLRQAACHCSVRHVVIRSKQESESLRL